MPILKNTQFHYLSGISSIYHNKVSTSGGSAGNRPNLTARSYLVWYDAKAGHFGGMTPAEYIELFTYKMGFLFWQHELLNKG